MRIFLLFILFGLSVPGICQDYSGWHPYFVTINRSAGLPTNEVYDMCEDDNGFMWLATGAGLYRYDGFTYVPWQCDQQTSAAGSCIRKDRVGRVWYENFDGYLYYTDGTRMRMLHQNQPLAFLPYGITEQHLFVPQVAGVDVFDLNTLKLLKTIEIPLKSVEHAACSNGTYYLTADGVLYAIDSLLHLKSYQLPTALRGVLHQLFPEGDSLYVLPRLSGENSLYVLTSALVPTGMRPVRAAGIQRGLVRLEGTTWLYTSLGCVDMTAGSINEGELLFEGKSISKMLRDRNGNYWFATTNEGIFIMPDRNNRVYPLGGTKVRQIAATQAGILAGTQTGELLELDAAGNSITTIGKDRLGADIYYLYADEHKVFYSGTGFVVLSTGNWKKEAVANIAIKQVVRLDNKYYVAAASGHCLLLRSGQAKDLTSVWDSVDGWVPCGLLPGSITILDKVRARAVAYDSAAQVIYVATNIGLMYIGLKSRGMITYDGGPLYVAQLATFGGVVYAADTKGRLLRVLRNGTSAELTGYAGGEGVRLLKVAGGKLYYCNGTHLYVCTTEDSAAIVDIPIDVADINDIAATDSNLWVATDGGIVAYAHQNCSRRVPKSGFFVNWVTVNEQPTDMEQLGSLSFSENNISIGYSIVEFAVVSPSMLEYCINDGEWSKLPANTRTLNFRALSAGRYNIKFRVNGRVVQEQVRFTIQRPFWQQAWFYIFVVITVLLVLLAVFSYRMKRKFARAEQHQQKLLMEERLSRSMLTALRSQMNPHFFFNALNTVQAYIFTNEKSKASDYLAKLSQLTRTILEMSEAETVVLANELEALNLYLELEKTRFGVDFRYRVHVEGITEPSGCEIPSMIIQPFVENAVKHGLLHKVGEKCLDICFEQKGALLLVTIDDNGIGRAKSEALNAIKQRKYRSYSTRATGERVKLLNAITAERIAVEIKDKTTTAGGAAGTKVTITIKL